MPPSPRLTISLLEDRYEALCESMGLSKCPGVHFIAKGGKTYGTWFPLRNRIEVYHGQLYFEVNRLRAVNAELVDTILHELRHAWQDQQHGVGWYKKNVVAAEKDAMQFAETNRHKWRGLIRVSRSQPARSRLPG